MYVIDIVGHGIPAYRQLPFDWHDATHRPQDLLDHVGDGSFFAIGGVGDDELHNCTGASCAMALTCDILPRAVRGFSAKNRKT